MRLADSITLLERIGSHASEVEITEQVSKKSVLYGAP